MYVIEYFSTKKHFYLYIYYIFVFLLIFQLIEKRIPFCASCDEYFNTEISDIKQKIRDIKFTNLLFC